MKLFRNIFIPIALLGSLLLSGCTEKEFSEITDLNLGRCLQPMNLNARVSASQGDVVTFSWDVTKDAETYLFTVLDSDGSSYLSEEVAPGTVPFQRKLEADKSFTFTVQARAEGKGDSKLAEYGKVFKTFATKSNLYLKVTDRTASSLTLAWSKDVEDYTEVDRIEVYLPGAEEPLVTKTLGADEIAAASATVEGLSAGTEYVATLFFKSASRGQVNVWTAADLSGFTAVSTVDALKNAVKTAGAKILLKMEGSPYVIDALDIDAGFTLSGEELPDGTKPVVQGEFHIADTWADGGSLIFENIEFSGAPSPNAASGFGFAIQNKNGGTKEGKEVKEISYTNCVIAHYTKGLFYEWSKAMKIGSLVYDSCEITDNNPDGTQGGDGIDIRYTSTIGKIAIVNNTISNGFRTFFRNYPQSTGSPAATITEVQMENNTVFNLCTVDATNNAGVIAFSEIPGSFSFKNNLFIGMSGKSKFGSDNANHKKLSDLGLAASNNWYFDVAETFFNDAWPASGGAFTALSANPCFNAPAGLFNLNPDAEIAGKEVGASKWWTPYVEEPEDLTQGVLDGATTWNLGNARNWSGTIKKSMVRDGLLLVASESNPVVAENGCLSFGASVVTDRKQVPADNYLAFKVATPGSVIARATGEGSAHFYVATQPVAGGDVTVKGGVSPIADAPAAQKIVISDISEPSWVYICPTGEVALAELAWSMDVSPVNTALPAPSPVVDPTSFTAGEATDVTVSWEPVPNAASYSVVFNGKTYTVSAEPWQYVIEGKTTGMLDAGSYTVDVIANPGKDDIYNTESAAGTAAFAVLPKGGSGESTELVVKTVEELQAAIAAGKSEISLAPGTYNLGILTSVKDMKLKAQTGATERPVVNGAVKIAGLEQGDLLFEGLEFVGSDSYSNAFTMSNKSGDGAAETVEATSLTIRNCVIRDYPKSVVYNPKGNKSTVETVIGSLLLENNIIKNCTTGQNTIDIRDGHYDEIRVVDNTFVNCAVSGADVFRIDDTQNGLVECPIFEVINNTFYNCAAASGKAVFYVREAFSTYKVMNNLFMGTDAAAGEYSRSTVVKPQLKNNFFFYVGENWFTGDIASDGTMLQSSPVRNAEKGDFTLTNALVMSCKAGASRWNPSMVPDSGDAFEVHDAEELAAALSAGKTDLILAAGEYKIDILSTVPGLRLTGAADGAKPVLSGAVKIAGENLGNVVFDNLKFVGSSSASNAFTVSNKSGDGGTVEVVSATSVTVRNCDITGYPKSVWYNPKGNKSTSESEIAAVTFDNCLITDCTTGQNTFDIRDGIYGMITVQNCTFVNCAVSGAEVFRMDNTQNGLVQCDGLVVRGNTFFNCSAASGKALFYVREDLKTYSITRNLFMGTDTAAGLFARARVALGEGFIAPTLRENFFFSMGANIFGENDDIKEGYGTILAATPVKDAAAGDFTLTNSLVMSCNAGAARWNPAYGTTSPTDFFRVVSAEEFADALSAGKKNIELAAGEYTLGSVVLSENINLRGIVTYGKKPVITGSFKLAGDLGDISLENLVIKGDASNTNAITVSNKSGDGAAVEVTGGHVVVKDCDFADYSKSVWYNPKGNKSTPESDIVSVLMTGCTFTNCTTGQNTIDIRDGKYGLFTIENSTFVNCAVSGADLVRIDDGQNGLVQMGTLTIRDNTFYNCAAASGKAILYVREDLEGYNVLRNLFVGKEGAGLFARARVALGDGFIAPTLQENYFFGMGANIFGEKDDIKEGYGTLLETAPCANPETGDFTTSLNVGDPRWNPASPRYIKKK